MTRLKVKVIKLTDDRFNGNHPNGVDAGYTVVGYCHQLPTVNHSFYVDRSKERFINPFYTSTVTEVGEDGVFKTLNSTYKYEVIDEQGQDQF